MLYRPTPSPTPPMTSYPELLYSFTQMKDSSDFSTPSLISSQDSSTNLAYFSILIILSGNALIVKLSVAYIAFIDGESAIAIFSSLLTSFVILILCTRASIRGRECVHRLKPQTTSSFRAGSPLVPLSPKTSQQYIWWSSKWPSPLSSAYL